MDKPNQDPLFAQPNQGNGNPAPAVRKAPPGSSGPRQTLSNIDGLLATGQMLGGNRFRVERYLGASPSTINYLCTDTQTDKKVVLKLIRSQLKATQADIQQISNAVATATSIRNQGLVSIMGMGTTGKGEPFIVADYVSGPSLGYIITEHRKAGRNISIRDLYAIMSHLCATLADVHKVTIHAVITPYNIHLTKSGTAVLSNLGFANQLASIEATNLHSGPFYDSIYVAPEIVEMPEMTSNVSDIYSLGMIAVELLHPVGLPAERNAANRQAHDFLNSLPHAIRSVLAAAIESNVTHRPKSVEEFISALESAAMQMEPNLYQEPGPDSLPVRALHTNQSSEGDLFDLPEFDLPTTDSEEGRYLLQINGLDYGPFTEEEVYKKLYSDEINEHTEILDRKDQYRCRLIEADVFKDKVKEYVPIRDERLRKQAEQREKNIKRVKSGGLGIFIAGILASALILGVLGFFLYRLPPPEPLPIALALPKQEFVFSPPPKEFVAVAVDKGFLELLFNPKASEKEIAKKLGKRRRNVTRTKKGKGGSAESDENITDVDLSATSTNHILTDGEVNEVIMSDFAAMRRCIMPQLKIEPGFKGITVLFFVRPSGTPGGVKIKEAKYRNSTVGKCMVSRFRNMRFPAHGGFNRAVSFPLNVQ